MPLSILRNHKCVALYGDILSGFLELCASSKIISMQKLGEVHIHWLYGNYKQFKVSKQKSCSETKVYKNKLCFTFSLFQTSNFRKTTFIVFASTVWNKQMRSWTEASEMCRNIAAYLPYFTDRQLLQELISILKTSGKIPPIEALYIGLKFHPNKVLFYNSCI